MTARSSLTIVLAAGEGTRMRSAVPKVLHPLAGQTLLAHVLRAAPNGAGAALAVLAARDAWARGADDLRVVFGDTPLISAATFERMRAPLKKGAGLAVLGFRAADPSGYGRLLVEGEKLAAIREHADATPAERAIKLCNAGVMAFDGRTALEITQKIVNPNTKDRY